MVDRKAGMVSQSEFAMLSQLMSLLAMMLLSKSSVLIGLFAWWVSEGTHLLQRLFHSCRKRESLGLVCLTVMKLSEHGAAHHRQRWRLQQW